MINELVTNFHVKITKANKKEADKLIKCGLARYYLCSAGIILIPTDNFLKFLERK